MSSVGYSIRQATKALLVAASITPIGTNIKARMMTKATKGIDTLPIAIVSPYGTIGDKPADFEGSRDRSFRVRIALIDAMSGDTETNDNLYSQWIEDAINAILVDDAGIWEGFQRETLVSVPSVWQIRADTINTFDDALMENGFYAFQNAVIRFDWQ